jgi:hypothetical protein
MNIESKAATPEEMRDDIVKYLKYQHIVKSSQARLAKAKRVKANFELQAKTFEFAANEIAAIVIKS